MNRTIGGLINLLNLRLKQELNLHIAQYHVTPEQWGLINTLYSNEGISQKVLAQIASKDQASITRMLELLIDKNLVYKKFSSEDKRSFNLHLTDQGRELRNLILPIILKLTTKAMDGFSEKEMEDFKRSLIKILANLDDLEKDY